MKRAKKVRKISYIFLLMTWIIGSVCMPVKKALATSAAVNLSLSTENVVIGSTFSVVLTVEASEEIGNFECNLSFDTDALQFVSGGAYVTGGNGLVLISDMDSSNDSISKKYSMKFKAIKGGETTIRMDEDVSISCALDDTKMSVSCNQLLLNITDPERISDDTSLSKLLVSSGNLSPKFSSNVKKYKMEVEYNINQISVKAMPSDEKATISVSGNTNLKAGDNTVNITVTAPSGDKAVTKIIVSKKDSENSEKQVKTKEKKQDNVIQSTGVTAYEDERGNRFLSEELRLQIVSLEDESLLPDDYEKTTIVMDGLPITVYTLRYDMNSDNLLVYGMNQDGETALYQYNRENNTLTKYMGINEVVVKQDTVTSDDMEKTTSATISFLIIICILAIACISLTIALVFQLIKAKSINNKNIKEDDFF